MVGNSAPSYLPSWEVQFRLLPHPPSPLCTVIPSIVVETKVPLLLWLDAQFIVAKSDLVPNTAFPTAGLDRNNGCRTRLGKIAIESCPLSRIILPMLPPQCCPTARHLHLLRLLIVQALISRYRRLLAVGFGGGGPSKSSRVQ